jgi:hypothetical protein
MFYLTNKQTNRVVIEKDMILLLFDFKVTTKKNH